MEKKKFADLAVAVWIQVLLFLNISCLQTELEKKKAKEMSSDFEWRYFGMGLIFPTKKVNDIVNWYTIKGEPKVDHFL